MLDKGDHDISKDERTMANEPIPIKSIFEPNICLTNVGWLHVCEHHILLLLVKNSVITPRMAWKVT
jgi:hypothetical protein